MPARKDFRQAEFELAEALADADRKNGLQVRSPDCPSPQELRRFVGGRSKQPDVVLAHLGNCSRCSQLLNSLRIHRLRSRRISLALVATAVLLAFGWLGLVRLLPLPAGVATIDLRFASPTRGGHNSATNVISARRSNGSVRVLLPIGSEGTYECEIQQEPGRPPIVVSSGQASVEKHDVVLDLPVNLAQVSSGKYTLAIRRSGSEWIYYLLELK